MNVAKGRVRGKYLRLTEETNALDCLERAGLFIRDAQADPKAWKWVLLALHGALYGFAISACRGTNPDNVTIKTKKGGSKLISFDRALSLCQNPDWMQSVSGAPLQLSREQRKSTRKLKYLLRDKFEHYVPRAWSVEVGPILMVAVDVLEAIRSLALDTGYYVHLTPPQKRRVRSVVFQSIRLLKNSQLYKGARPAGARV